jgi:hypothetical protein
VRGRWGWQYLLTLAGIALVAAAVLLPLRALSARRPAPVSSPAATAGPEIRLFALPARILRVCRQADAGASFPVVCPSHLPRPTAPSTGRGDRPAVQATLLGTGARVYGVSLGYSAPRDRPALNRPTRFLHLVLVGGRAARDPENLGTPLGSSELGGHPGRMYRGRRGGLHHHHVVFVWSNGGTWYAASLHEWDSTTETIALLDRLVGILSSPNSLG